MLSYTSHYVELLRNQSFLNFFSYFPCRLQMFVYLYTIIKNKKKQNKMEKEFNSVKTVKLNNKEFRVRELMGYFIVDCFELWRNESTKQEVEGWVYKFHSKNESEVYEQIEHISNSIK